MTQIARRYAPQEQDNLLSCDIHRPLYGSCRRAGPVQSSSTSLTQRMVTTALPNMRSWRISLTPDSPPAGMDKLDKLEYNSPDWVVPLCRASPVERCLHWPFLPSEGRGKASAGQRIFVCVPAQEQNRSSGSS